MAARGGGRPDALQGHPHRDLAVVPGALGEAQIDLQIGKKVSRETQTDEEGKFRIVSYEMTGTVTIDGVAYPITGCQYREFRK